MKYLKSKWMLLLALIVGVAVLAAFTFSRTDKPKYFTARVDRGDIHDVVEATGTIDAVKTVQVGSQVSGTISNLHADFNSRVKTGQVVAEIDPSLFEGALLQAKADLQDAQANLAAGAHVIQHCPGPDQDACLRQDRRIRRRSDQGRPTRDVYG